MIPGIPGGTQLAWGESCGGLAWNSFCMAAYAGVSENGCGGPKSPAPRTLSRAARPNVISQTPFMSGNCAMDAHVPPGNLLASAAKQEEANAINPRVSPGRTKA